MSENEKQQSTQKRNKKGSSNEIIAVMFNVVCILVFFAVFTFKTKTFEESIKTIQEDMNAIQEDLLQMNKAETDLESTEESTYSDGIQAASDYLYLRADIVTLYKGDAITYEQLKKYVERNLYLIKLSYSNAKISSMDIEKYNKIIEEIGLKNYDKYYLETTEEFLNGFKDYLKAQAYYQIVKYYYDSDQIPSNKYEAFKLAKVTLPDKENVKKYINYARDIIEDCIGNPDDVILSTEWRKYTTVKDFLTKTFQV